MRTSDEEFTSLGRELFVLFYAKATWRCLQGGKATEQFRPFLFYKLMKSILRKISIVAILLVFHVTNSLAESFIVDGIGYNILSDSTVEVTDKEYRVGNVIHSYYYEGDIVIPSTVTYQRKSYTVTSIAGGQYPSSGAFWGCSNLTSITIPSTVSNIGSYAFGSCTSLTSIVIPNSVTNIGNYAFQYCSSLGSIDIPSGITTIGWNTFAGCSSLKNIEIPNSVTIIANGAFEGCTSLTKIVIPESVNLIGVSAFHNCSNLTDITILSSITSIETGTFRNCTSLQTISLPSSISKIGDTAFSGCSNLKKIVIPNGVKTIEQQTFEGCISLSDVSIPNTVTIIEKNAFQNCSSLKDINIPNSVLTIEGYSFSYTGLESITIPNSVNKLGSGAFYHCTDLVTASIGDGVEIINEYLFSNCTSLRKVTIGSDGYRQGLLTTMYMKAFPDNNGLEVYINPQNVKNIYMYKESDLYVGHKYTSFYAPLVSLTMLKLWHEFEKNTFDIATKLSAEVPHLEWSCTQTTASLNIVPIYDGYRYMLNNVLVSKTHYDYVGLRPGESFQYPFVVWLGNDSHPHTYNFQTLSLNPTITARATPTTITAKCSYTEGDANVIRTEFRVANRTIEGNECVLTGLNPEVTHNAEYYVTVRYGENNDKTYRYEETRQIKTSKLTLNTQQPKVISPGNVIVQAVSNISDTETNVGFEWRRTDWTEDFTSNSGTAYLYEGTMEGYIRNLNTEKLWKYRPYYESASGKRYYGDWVGIDPTNTSYFEPTVHTYADVNVNGNTAAVRGYVMRGSDNIVEQGFKYWGQVVASRTRAASIPMDATTVTSTGTVMEATLTNLSYGTTYSYVAYVKTSEGETFYGEERQFTTGVDPVGIEDTCTEDTDTKPVAYYDLKGRRLNKLQSGLVIVRMSDGTTRKIMIK